MPTSRVWRASAPIRLGDSGAVPNQTGAEPPVAVVILNWHGLADTEQCLRALARLSYPCFSAIVIDNGCQELSPAAVAALLPQARYLHSPANLGFAGGANLGMRQALAAGAELVWFLNSDARAEPESLREMVAVAARDRRIGIVGPKIVQVEDPHRLDSVALHLDLRRGRLYLLGHDEEDSGQYDGLADTAAVTGCAMLVTRAACERTGGFDDSYFAYLEDADLCLRAVAAGFRVVVAPRARVHHRRATATKGRQSLASLYYTTRNHLRLMREHGSGRALQRALRPAVIVALNLAYALRAGGAPLPARIAAVCRGVRAYRHGEGGSGKDGEVEEFKSRRV